MLQKIVGAEQDGSIGPGTVGATKSQDAKDVVAKMTAARREYYRALPTFNHFGNGWTNRTNDIGQRALEMVKA
jgi:lysozyme family protein